MREELESEEKMHQLLSVFADHMIYVAISGIVLVVAMLITILVHAAAKQLRFMKYVPGLVFILVGMTALFMVANRLFEKSSLDNLFVAMLGIMGGLESLFLAMLLGSLSHHRED